MRSATMLQIGCNGFTSPLEELKMMRLGLSMTFPTKNVPEEVAQATMDYK